MKTNKSVVFEVSWEVCNKVGGIHTVIKSKLAEAVKNFGQNYFLVGPLFDHNPEFIEQHGNEFTNIGQKLYKSGIKAKIGIWNTPEKPRVILVKFKESIDQSRLLYTLWKDFGVDSMTGGSEYQEAVLFSTMAGKVIEAISQLSQDAPVTAHFHDWMSAAGLLYLKKHAPKIATVLTSHSTAVGHAICSNGLNLYNTIDQINSDREAAKWSVAARHSLESACAREADLFTTVSSISELEVQNILNVSAKKILLNGYDVMQHKAAAEDQEYRIKCREKLLKFASSFLRKELKSEETVIISTSGRNEFTNKGIDIFLESLTKLKAAQSTQKTIVAFIFSIGSARQPNESFRTEKYSSICTHPVWEPASNPVVNEASRLGIDNKQDDKIHLIYVPASLDGSDGIINMEYLDALIACDLTIYPSWYEPWGYTPLESIACSVLTICSDVSGFGRWIQSISAESDGIKVAHRQNVNKETTISEIVSHISRIVAMDTSSFESLRASVRETAMLADWQKLFHNYIEAYESAFTNSIERVAVDSNRHTSRVESSAAFRGTNSPRPRFKQFSVITSLPKQLERLRDLAHNIWWVWNADATELFIRLDPVLFEKIGNNPVALLEIVDPAKLDAISKNESYLLLYDSVMKKFDKYMSMQGSLLKELEGVTPERPVAYFSMEFGLHECLPLYSGGLGILSGDHMKSASDINLPLFGVGLLYKNGYFKQGISKDGVQKVEYFHNDFFRMPLREVTRNGERLTIGIDFPGRMVYARIWEANVGRVSIYFLDTDIQENSGSDREITAKLYGGDKRTRIEQEIVLGIGGVRLVEEMNLNPSVYHLNEGHSSFLIVERFINLMKYFNLDFNTAGEIIKGSTVFTTHTPVPAGNETFDMSLVENYLRNYVESNNITWQNFCDMGHKRSKETGPFEMTVLALKYTNKRNGVSRLHKLVSRDMWQDLWNGYMVEEAPIDHITNGVHPGTWLTSEIHSLLLKYASVDMHEDLLKIWAWDKAAKIPDEQLWQAHLYLKTKLYNTVKERITSNWTREGEDPAMLDRFLMKFSPNALTIGFARRFATYKRATLFMKNIDRIRNILSNKKHPVQFIIAGKAHPADKVGADLIRDIAQLCKQDEYLGQIIFVENYDMTLARRLISGADVWLNNPRRPLEASGTSGQKAGMNGVINCSVLDGWWDEGYNGQNGWAIGERKEYTNTDMQDLMDSDSLYDILENELIPSYYQRNMAGIPEKWVRMMKQSIISTISEFNTHRMLKDYAKKLYVPTAKSHELLVADNFKLAREMAEQKVSLAARFSSIQITNVQIDGIKGDNLAMNDEAHFTLEANLGRIDKKEVCAQIVLIQDKSDPAISFTKSEKLNDNRIRYVNLELVEEKGNEVKYRASFKATMAGKFNYGARIIPAHKEIEEAIDTNLVYWA